MSPDKPSLSLPHGALEMPLFLPDATQGVVRAADSRDLEECGIQAVVMNAFHLMQRPGSSTIHALAGLHRMAGWNRPIVTDSGGFQAYSLIRQNPKRGLLTNKEIIFRPDDSGRKVQLSPEKSIQLQLSYGADVAICLDDCTHVDDPFPAQQESVRRTVDWAARCKEEFERILHQKKPGDGQRPLLFAVIQGGGSRELRRECASRLLEIGFDGYGYGGWPLDAEGNLLTEMIAYTRSLIPSHLPMHALGVGHPANIAECARLGYGIFDSAMPTRDARHGRLYRWAGGAAPSRLEGKWLDYLYIGDKKHIKIAGPVSRACDGLCCARYSLGYLHHLFKISDTLFFRLATIHNLRFMSQLTGLLREIL
ncbi:MAG: queuine tRNA-ribosyltransferase family protein [Armatimonadetes bacterium]|nr:queuine tRNA-ribosyltransferase family protein [Armatimonadota bacterium]